MVQASSNEVGFYDEWCIDGADAADALHTAMPGIKLVPISYRDPAKRMALFKQHITPGSTVYFVDTATTPDETHAIADPFNSQNGIGACAKSIHIWDHHYTSEQNLGGFALSPFVKRQRPALDICIDVTKASAGQMVREKLGLPVSWLDEFIGDMEPHGHLKKSDYPVAAYIDSFSLATPDDVLSTFNALQGQSLKDMAVKGALLHQRNIRKINGVFNKLRYSPLEILPGQFAMVPMVNVNVRECGRSIDDRLREVGKAWLWPRVAIAWFKSGDQVIGSVRSTGGRNSAEIGAHLGKQFGGDGGGHKMAAAFSGSAAAFELIPQETQLEVCRRVNAAHRSEEFTYENVA